MAKSMRRAGPSKKMWCNEGLDPKRNSKALQVYLRQSMTDTLTLYLHGLCCDIDIEAGPRQLASASAAQAARHCSESYFLLLRASRSFLTRCNPPHTSRVMSIASAG